MIRRERILIMLRSALVAAGLEKADAPLPGDDERGEALKKLQARHGVAQTGKVDTATRQLLERLDREEHRRYDEAAVLSWEIEAICRARRAEAEAPPDKAAAQCRHDAVTNPAATASERIAQARKDAHSHDLIGLALSGGGIRSASLNLGVIQAFAEHGLLKHFDYLSTVSGGGYIGSWLSSGVHRSNGLENFQDEFLENESKALLEGRPHPIQHLRDHTNYLTPRTGFFSADVWTFGVTYLRNLLLNLIILVACFVAVLVCIRLVGGLGTGIYGLLNDENADGTKWILIKWGLGLSFTLALALALGFISATFERELLPWARGHWRMSSKVAARTFLTTLFVSAYAGSLWLWLFPVAVYHMENLFAALGLGLTICLAGFGAAHWLHRKRRTASSEPGPDFAPRLVFMASFLVSTVLAALLLFVVFREYRELWFDDSWRVASLTVPATILVFCASFALMTGLGGRMFPERIRELWARMGAAVLVVTLIWTLAFAVTIHGPMLVEAVGDPLRRLGLAGMFGYTATALLLARSSLTGARAPSGSRLEPLVIIAPWLFIVGAGIYLSWLLNVFLESCWLSGYWADTPWLPSAREPKHCTVPELADLPLNRFQGLDAALYNSPALAAIAFLLAFGYALSARVDINLFSLHPLYRNRLVRSYLGATRSKREPHPETLFDEADDEPLAAQVSTDGTVKRPYHLINCAINLTTGERLAWQERKASSFVMSPRFCGYNLGDVPTGAHGGGCYRLTGDFARFDPDDAGLTLGTAMTISGAAASPNMGYHSSSKLALLMTVFNMRLGWWAPNTKRAELWQERSGPRMGLMYLIHEMLGMVNSDNDYVHLSDGGHFENLGIYELVRRRCRLIVCSDASRDQGFSFEDLGNAVRKCQIDFGVRIDFPDGLPPSGSKANLLQKAWAIGIIHYEDVDGPDQPSGFLVYLKSSLTGRESADILSYSREHSGFPHDATTNQWFSESRFESYRKLGRYVAWQFLRDGLKLTPGTLGREELVQRVEYAVLPEKPLEFYDT